MGEISLRLVHNAAVHVFIFGRAVKMRCDKIRRDKIRYVNFALESLHHMKLNT